MNSLRFIYMWFTSSWPLQSYSETALIFAKFMHFCASSSIRVVVQNSSKADPKHPWGMPPQSPETNYGLSWTLKILSNSWKFSSVQFCCSVMSDSATPWITARQASLSITISRSSLRLTFIESVMPSSHLILGRPLLLLPPTPPSIRVFSNESTLRMSWPKY